MSEGICLSWDWVWLGTLAVDALVLEISRFSSQLETHCSVLERSGRDPQSAVSSRLRVAASLWLSAEGSRCSQAAGARAVVHSSLALLRDGQ